MLAPFALTAETWQVIASGVALIPTAVLAGVAVYQAKKIRDNANDARDERKEDAARQAAAEERRDSAVRRQLAALGEITQATRDTARAQLQPIVFAHAHEIVRGPDDAHDIGEHQVALTYRLANEGVGPALNIRHGVELGGRRLEFGEGMETRTLQPGESMPPIEAATGQPVQLRLPAVVLDTERVGEGEDVRVYWAQFENVFGEAFETLNPSDPRRSAAFERLNESASNADE